MSGNKSQLQEIQEKPFNLEASLGQKIMEVRKNHEQKKIDKEKADYNNHNKNVIQPAGGHGQSVDSRGEPTYNKNRFNVSRQKSSKRKSSRQKSPKRKGSKI